MFFARLFLAVIISLAGGFSVFARPPVEASGLAEVFERRGAAGCFALFDPRSETLRVYNPERARKRLLPASTFKIANALIGLELGAVRNVDEVIPYGGTDEAFDAWERDMSLREGIRISNVPVFHELARRVGIERMGERLQAFRYGNAEVGPDLERRFWLIGPLAISALEQVDFLRRLCEGELPIRPETAAAVREILAYEATAEYALFGKSGWGGPREPETGWWVGWVETDGMRFPFAVNIDAPSMEGTKLRLPVALDCLKALGVLPE